MSQKNIKSLLEFKASIKNENQLMLQADFVKHIVDEL